MDNEVGIHAATVTNPLPECKRLQVCFLLTMVNSVRFITNNYCYYGFICIFASVYIAFISIVIVRHILIRAIEESSPRRAECGSITP